MKVNAWNTYKIDGTGELVVVREVAAQSITQALDVAESEALSWNARHRSADMAGRRVNMLSCGGYVRAI